MTIDEGKCDYCKDQSNCRNLFVSLKILEEEMRYVKREELVEGFQKLKEEIATAGFAYPYGKNACALAAKNPDVIHFLNRAERLLRILRKTQTIL